jgi:hypothetical protein
MMRQRMMFCETVGQILKTRAPLDVKLALFHPILDPIEAYIHGFCSFLFNFTVAVTRGSGIIRFIGVGGCLCHNSSNVVLRTAPSLAFMKTAPISASAADYITCLRTLRMIKIAPFVSFFSFLLLFSM